jgi:hypothetical protein
MMAGSKKRIEANREMMYEAKHKRIKRCDFENFDNNRFWDMAVI